MSYNLFHADIGGLSRADGPMESLLLSESIAHETCGIKIKSLYTNCLASQLKAFSVVWNKIERNEILKVMVYIVKKSKRNINKNIYYGYI